MADESMEVQGQEGQVDVMEEAAKMLVDEQVPSDSDETVGEPAKEEPSAPAPAPEADGGKEDSKTGLWARITQQDKELRQLRSQLKDRTSIDDLRSIARKDPAKILADLGIGIDQVIDALAAQQGVEPGRVAPEQHAVPKEIEQMRQELAALRQEQAAARQEAMMRAEVMRIDEAIKTNPERWEVIAAQRDEGSLRLVLETAAELWKATGEVPDYEIVMDSVEEHLASEAKARLDRLSGIRKFRREAQPPQPQQPVVKGKNHAPVVTGNAPSTRLSELTEEQRMELAIAALKDDVDEKE